MSGEHAYDMQVPDLASHVEQATTDFVEKSEHIAKCLRRPLQMQLRRQW